MSAEAHENEETILNEAKGEVEAGAGGVDEDDELELIDEFEGVEDSGNSVADSIQQNIIGKKILYTFNRFFIDFLKEIKGKSGDISRAVKKYYKCVDKMSAEYIDAWQQAFDYQSEHWSSSEKVLGVDIVLDAEVLKGVSVRSLLEQIDAADHSVVARYIYTMHLFNSLYQDLDERNFTEIDSVFGKVLACMKAIDAKADVEDIVSDVMDDNIVSVIHKMAALPVSDDVAAAASSASASSAGSSAAFGAGGIPGFDDEFFKTSKIGQLAKDISSSIDVSKLNISDPSELMNMEKLMSGNNTGLANIIQQVGATITQKIQTGELKQEELIADAMSMVSKLNSGGGGGMGPMGDMMKMMMRGTMGGGIKKNHKTSVRDRLKRRVAERESKGDK